MDPRRNAHTPLAAEMFAMHPQRAITTTVRCALERLARASLGLTLLLLVPCILKLEDWPAELILHWHHVLLALLALHLPWLVWRRRWVLLVLLAAAIAHGSFHFWPWIGPSAPTPDAEGSSLTVMTLNAHAHLADHDALLDGVLQSPPDLLIVQEITQDNALAFHRRLHALYPYQHIADPSAAFTLVLASRHPTFDLKVLRTSALQLPQIYVRVQTPLGEVSVFAVHLHPPVTFDLIAAHRGEIQILANSIRAARSQRAPVILAGDLNLTPWAPSFVNLVQATGLTDPRRDHGLHATWSPFALLPFALLPIDHVLTSTDLVVSELQRGPFHRSDHRPLLATIRRAPAPR